MFRSNTNEEPLVQHESRPSPSVNGTHNILQESQMNDVSCPYPRNSTHEQGEEETLRPKDQSQVMSFSSRSTTPTDGEEETVITSIRATAVSLGLRRIPAGFYVVVHHSGLEWRTENKPSSVIDDTVEWSGPIPIPTNSLTMVCLEVYASFEFQSSLGAGEQLRQLSTTVEQLLHRIENEDPFTFLPKDGDVISPCSSIFVAVNRHKSRSSDSQVSKSLSPHGSTTESQGELEDATNQGHDSLSHYREHGDPQDLECSIERFEHALNICPLDHSCRAAAQSNLAMAKLMHYKLENVDAFLETSLTLYRDALAARPVGHIDRPSTLIQLAMVYFTQYEKQGVSVEAVGPEALLREAIELSSTESHENRVATFMLEIQVGRRIDSVQGDSKALGEDLSSCSKHEDLWALSKRLLDRFEQFGDLADLQEAITTLEELVKSTTVSDHRNRAVLASLGMALQDRFNQLGELKDIEEAVSMLKDAVDSTPHDHPDKPTYLDYLGNSLTDRFERRGQLSDLQDAISSLTLAVDLTPNDHPDRPGHLNNLGNTFLASFERFGELSDLKEAVLKHKEAVKLISHDHPDKPTYLSSLGNSLFLRFQCLGELNDIEDAISRHKEAVDLTPPGHPHKPGHLNNLGNCYNAHFERFGELSVLEDAISTLRNAVCLTPHGHSSKPGRLEALGNSLKSRFNRLAELGDLEDAISILRDGVNLTPHGHPEMSNRLNNLGNAFLIRFECLGELGDLEDAISRHENAVELTPRDHRYKPSYLNNLGNSFKARFERCGEPGDLEVAISTYRDAITLIPHDHPAKPALLNNLGNCLFSRSERSGVEGFSNLEAAILCQRDAIDLTPSDHPDKPGYVHDLGRSIHTRWVRTGELSDMEDALLMLEDVVRSTPHGHPRKPSYLNSLSNSFKIRFTRYGELSDLESAISSLKDAVHLTPRGHPHKPVYLGNLGNCLMARFQRLRELGDLEDTISTLRDAVDITPHDHPNTPCHLRDLGDAFKARFERFGTLSDLEQAISLYSRAASTSIGPIAFRFRASRNWISSARGIQHHSLIHAYSVAISLLPQLAWIGLPLTSRYSDLMQGADVAREAAAVMLDSGHPEVAVEWLEQGRSIIWGEMFQLRSPYEELLSAHPGHALRLRELSVTLEFASTARENSSESPELAEELESAAYLATGFPQQVADRCRMLAIERDKLLQEIRTFPGFEQFLLHKDFSQLRAAAHSGPVVILNAAESRCDALIILAKVDHVIHVPLPKFSSKRSTGLQNMLNTLLGHARAIRSDDREGSIATWSSVNWEFLLSTLWVGVVKPVLDALAFSVCDAIPFKFATDRSIYVSQQIHGDLSRIFWCPTGPFVFLPIHAAGFYPTRHSRSQAGQKVSDFVISSYVPNLAILELSPKVPVVPCGDLCLLAIRQSPSDGLSPLPGAVTELEHIKAVIRNSPAARTTLLESPTGTVEEVLSMMKEADWVHFACHGIQDVAMPMESGLCLAEQRRLKLKDIIALSRPRGGLAFLSACQTAMGGKHLSDEAMHIAAGMLFAGYGGVIGTMWSISDKLAPDVARDVYRHLFRNDAGPDYREAALALHKAIERLRDSSKAPFVTWLPFIHVGL